MSLLLLFPTSAEIRFTSISIDTLLQKTDTSTILIDTLIEAVVAQEISIDTCILSTELNTILIDTLIGNKLFFAPTATNESTIGHTATNESAMGYTATNESTIGHTATNGMDI